MQILYGRPVAEKIKQEVQNLKTKYSIKDGTIKLVIILVGENPSSVLYVNNKIKFSKHLGFITELIKFPLNVSYEDFKKEIFYLNKNILVHGILIQLPLPDHLSFNEVIELVDPNKDVDGFHPHNVGRLALGNAVLKPCTPAAIIRMLDFYDINTQVRVLVIGRSSIVGTPLTLMLSRLNINSTVTLAHSYTSSLKSLVEESQIIISAVGKPIVSKEWVNPESVIIDVGVIPRYNEEGALYWVGDVEPDTICRAKSPVPGGVGPVTVAMLLYNTLQAYLLQNEIL